MKFLKHIFGILFKKINFFYYNFLNLFSKSIVKKNLKTIGVKKVKFWMLLRKIDLDSEFKIWAQGYYNNRKIFIKIGNHPTIKNEVFIFKNLKNPHRTFIMPINIYNVDNVNYVFYNFLPRHKKLFELKHEKDVLKCVDDFKDYLQWAKNNNFLHGDISFGNTCYYNGELKILDFGLSLIKIKPSIENSKIYRNGYHFKNIDAHNYIIDDAHSFCCILVSKKMRCAINPECISDIRKFIGFATETFRI